MPRGRRDIKPVLLKFGVAVALSFGGILYAYLRSRKIKASSGDRDKGAGRNDNLALQKTTNSSDPTSVAPEKHESFLAKGSTDSFTTALSPSGRLNEEKDHCLLPEFDELVKDISFSPTKLGSSPPKDVERLHFDGERPMECKYVQSCVDEQEITRLRNMVQILKDRERNLEIQLLEYHGLREQESAAMELQNRLKIHDMEAKIFSLKIESLQADKRRLEEQISDHAKVVSELDAAKAKIKLLRKNLRTESEHNRQQILALQERVLRLQEQEKKATAPNEPDTGANLEKLKDLEQQVVELKRSNSNLKGENSDLVQKLEYVQLLARSVLEDGETTAALKEESHGLRQENEGLTKDIERLQADRSTDVEELVYLRWINACLRYQLRDYQPGPGKTIARDLAKTLSPRSEEKAKQLIVEYTTKEGQSEKGTNPIDFDSDMCSSSQSSYFTTSGELGDSSDLSSANKTPTSSKTKLFNKLMRLFSGSSVDSPRYSSVSTRNETAAEEGKNRWRSSSHGSRCSWDFQGLSEDGSYCILKRFDTVAEHVTDPTPLEELNRDPENKPELIKSADPLKDTRKRLFGRRSLSLGSHH